MVRKDGAEVRRQRIQDIGTHVMALLHKTDREIPYGRTVSALSYEFGLTKDKVKEYLSILEDLGRFVLDNERDRIRKVEEEETNS